MLAPFLRPLRSTQVLHSGPAHRRTSGCQGSGSAAGTGRAEGTEEESEAEQSGREVLALSQALLTVFLTWQW